MTYEQKIKVARAVKDLMTILHPEEGYSYQTVDCDGTFALIVIRKPVKQ